jgi:hypothetical protein
MPPSSEQDARRGVDPARPAGRDTARRVAGSEITTGGEVKLQPGGVVDLVNLSETGALVETRNRLAVGATVTLLIGGARPQRLAGRIVRCQVCAIHRDSTMSYQLGIAFNQAAQLEVAADAAAGVEAGAPAASAPAGAAASPPAELANEW